MHDIKEIFSENKNFYSIAFAWIILGIFTGPGMYLIPFMVILMYRRRMLLEILLGFFFILILSDSRLKELQFAAQVKNFYILILALICYTENRNYNFRNEIIQNFVPFILISTICLFFSPIKFISFQKTLSYVLLFYSVPIFFKIVYQINKEYLFRALTSIAVLVILLGLILDIFFSDITKLEGRYRGMLGNPNGLGLFVFLFLIFYSLLIEFKENFVSKKSSVFIYVICFLSLLKCGARTSLATTLMFFFFKRFYKLNPWVGFFVATLSVFIFQLITSNLTSIILSFGLGEALRVETLDNGSGREIAWKFAWEQIQNNFFIGNGFSFTEYLYRLNYEYLSMLGHQGSAHNTYLTLWLDVGLVGLIAFLIAIFLTFYKASKFSPLAFPILYSILFSNNYESWLTASLNPFTIQLLFVLTLIFINKECKVFSNKT
jgi:O-antigen ligase